MYSLGYICAVSGEILRHFFLILVGDRTIYVVSGPQRLHSFYTTVNNIIAFILHHCVCSATRVDVLCALAIIVVS